MADVWPHLVGGEDAMNGTQRLAANHRRRFLAALVLARRITIGMRWSKSIFLVGAVLSLCTAAGADDAEVRYRRDILPLLSDRCFKCHGPDSASREAGLRLDRADDAYAELPSGLRAIVPNRPEESAVLERIETVDPEFAMPPSDSGKSLSSDEKALVRRWIEADAVYEPHWAFVAPKRPPVPNVKHQKLVQNPIDAFVFARLEAESVEPAQRASAERIIRRLNFDLVGLPPTLAEIDEFVANNSPAAVQRAVDRLLASPQYGERMAAEWLDGAHYADSNGYQNDFAREMWPWRDWVIEAFNRNLPYDQFLTEQLAGDLLPNPTQSQRVATGFCRNNRTVTEAGSIDEEWLVENVVDRTETLGTVFLGLTVGCARCHDHKFDPLTQKEFYQLYAFFNNVNEKGVYVEQRGNVAPLIKVATPEQQKQLQQFDNDIARLTADKAAEMLRLVPLRSKWIEVLANSYEPREPEAAVSVLLQSEMTTALAAAVDRHVEADATSQPPLWRDGLFGRVSAFTGGEQLEYSRLQFPPADRPFSWSVWVKPQGDGAIFSKMEDAAAFRGCDLLVSFDQKIAVHVIHQWPVNAIKIVTRDVVPRDKWSHVAVSYDGSSKAAGLKVYFDGLEQPFDVDVDQLTQSFATKQPFRIGRRSEGYPLHGEICDVRLFQHALSADEVAAIHRGSLHRVLRTTKPQLLDPLAAEQFDALMLAHWDDPATAMARQLTQDLYQLTTARKNLDDAIPTTMVMEERTELRPTYLLNRGQYDLPDKSQRLTADVPQVLPPLPADAPRNRLGLARWLSDPANPLTARVAVNRLWQQFFGLGLVKTPENFGVQSEPPSHPELLDWLAVELIESQWNIQHIQRLIVESYVYQQSADVAATAYERDPENRLLARGPRYRLSAETMRDNSLAVSGLLTQKIGGPSVMPYQPPGLWEELAGGAFEVYKRGSGDDLYRRSLYIYRKRTVPHPSLATFDAPSWEICQVKRARTNTPLQSLALLNDVVYVEAARKLAERMIRDGGNRGDDRLIFAFRLATGRRPTERELIVLRNGLDKQLARYRLEPNAAEQLVTQGESPRATGIDVVELAAHTAMASVILNLDEAVSKN